MSWLTPELPTHKCVPENVSPLERGYGSLWKCDECGKVSKLIYHVFGYVWVEVKDKG